MLEKSVGPNWILTSYYLIITEDQYSLFFLNIFLFLLFYLSAASAYYSKMFNATFSFYRL